MRIEKFVFGPVGTNCYIVINEMTSECFAVDMADCPQEFVKHIKDAGPVSYTHLTLPTT